MEPQESSDRCGYCDLHLEAKLLHGKEWLGVLDGSDKTRCELHGYWRCSHPDCNRCYDPRVFGYFNLPRIKGNRIEPSPTQERCYCHKEGKLVLNAELSGIECSVDPCSFDPFMFVGKVRGGRQFQCPIRGCHNVGSVVAEHVADVDEVEVPPVASVVELAGDGESKELSVFIEFANAAHLSVESPENARPNRPDIHCRIDGEEYWFELGRISDTSFARRLKSNWPGDSTPFSFAQEEPFVRIVKQKATKRYDTNGRPVDLVLHFDHQPPDTAALQRYVQKHAAALEHLRQGGPFSRVWIYDEWSKRILWQSP